jgi:hypothetical protein
MRRVVTTFGLIAGAVLAAMMVITAPFHDRIGFDRGLIIGYATMVAAFLMVFFGVKSYRDTMVGGTVGFGRALGAGLGITAVATVCYAAAWEIVSHTLLPDFAEKYAAYAIAKARAAGGDSTAVAATVRRMAEFQQMYRNPLARFALTLLEPLPIGLGFSLLSAWILSRRPVPPTPPPQSHS